MTQAEDRKRMRLGSSSQAYEERREHYARNAQVEADRAVSRARASRRGVTVARSAADNARRNSDLAAASLYTQMAAVHSYIAEAQQEMAEIAQAVSAHYENAVQRP